MMRTEAAAPALERLRSAVSALSKATLLVSRGSSADGLGEQELMTEGHRL